MRDKLIHAYFGLDIGQVWLTATVDLPALKVEVESILKKESLSEKKKTGDRFWSPVVVFGSSVSGLGDHSGEGLWIAHGQIGQHFAVEGDVGFLHHGDQTAIGCSVLSRRGVDAGNPQPPQIAFAQATIARGIPQALQHGLVGALEEQVLGTTLPFGELQYFLVT